MSTSLVVNGVSYLYPDTGDQSWGTVASAWAAAVTNGMLQKAGGTFTLTADANFGTNFGLLSKYFTSQSSNASASGIVRLASTEAVSWRNNANNADIALSKNSSDQLTYAGTAFLSSSGVVLVAGGGTGITSGISGGILGFTASGTLASSAALTANQIIVGGGAGATPSTLAAGSQYQPLVMGASAPGYGALNLAQSAAVTGILPNANTTATNANTASTIVARDGSGNFTAGTITAALTGTASGNTTYTANQYGVVFSGSGNAMSVLAPDASTSKVLVSGGSSAIGAWSLITNSNLSGSAAISNANLATMTANTVKANVTGSTATPTDVSILSTATASAVVIRDTNANARFNNVIENFASTTTAAGTTTLTVSSSRVQQFTGSTTQTVTLPDATTLVLGQSFTILNRSSGIVTVNANGGGLVQSMSAASQCTFTVTSIGSSAGSWDSAISYTSGSGSGSVTSVTFTGDGTVLSSTPSSAVTTSGTITASLNTQTKNKIFAGPASGSAASPTFRSLGAADMVQPIVTKTANYTITTADYCILGNTSTSSAFTLTMPDATTCSGQSFQIVYTGTGYANALTVASVSSQTFGVSGPTTTTLNTPNERLILKSDGSNWQIINRSWDMTWTTFSLTINGSVSNPTKGTTTEKHVWRRVGDSIEIVISYQQTVAGSSGSGTYRYVLPNSLSIDTAKIQNNGGSLGIIGHGVVSGNADSISNTSRVGFVSCDSQTTSVSVFTLTDGSAAFLAVGSGNFGLGNTNVDVNIRFTVPISGWKGL